MVTPCSIVGASLAGPSVGFPVEAREGVHALSIVVNVAPASAVCRAVAFPLSFRAQVTIALAPLQMAWVVDI